MLNVAECNLLVLRVCRLRMWLRFGSCTTLVDIESSSKKMIVKVGCGRIYEFIVSKGVPVPLFKASNP